MLHYITEETYTGDASDNGHNNVGDGRNYTVDRATNSGEYGTLIMKITISQA